MTQHQHAMKFLKCILLLIGVFFSSSSATLFLTNKEVNFDPTRQLIKEENGKENEMYFIALEHIYLQRDYIAEQRKQRTLQHIGPLNGANLTHLFNLLGVNTLDEAKAKLENIEKLDDDTQAEVLAEISGKQIDDNGTVIPNIPVTSQNAAKIEEITVTAKKEFEKLEAQLENEEVRNDETSRSVTEEEKHVFCFFNAQSALERGYDIKTDAPFEVCTAIVYCCVQFRHTEPHLYFRNGTNESKSFDTILTFLAAKHAKIDRYFALGGPHADYALMSQAMQPKQQRRFTSSVINWLKAGKARQNLHLALYVAEPHRLASILDFQYFVKNIATAVTEMRRFALVIPSCISDSSVFSYIMQANHVILMDTPERLNDPKKPQCPINFRRYFKTYKRSQNPSSSMRPTIFYSVTAGFMLRGYSYNETSKPTLSLTGYETNCNNNVTKQNTSTDECLISEDTGSWAATLTPKTFLAWKSKNIIFNGVAIMDVEWDDFKNKCGQGTNPILSAIKQVLK